MIDQSLGQQLRQAAVQFRNAQAVIITAGAGMGVDSGLPDFRGQEGFWNTYPAAARRRLNFQELANPRWFHSDPHLAWAFYGHRLQLYRDTVPHAGFAQLRHLAEHKPGGYFVFTSNVDGQFQAAGYDPEEIVECHGSIHHFQCVTPCCEEIWDAQSVMVSVDTAAFSALDPLPVCPFCSCLARPNILMFDDWQWLGRRTQAQEERLRQWLQARSGMSCVIVEIGAGHAVPTVRLTSEALSRRLRAPLIRINPRDDTVPPGHIGLPLGAAEGIARLIGQI